MPHSSGDAGKEARHAAYDVAQASYRALRGSGRRARDCRLRQQPAAREISPMNKGGAAARRVRRATLPSMPATSCTSRPTCRSFAGGPADAGESGAVAEAVFALHHHHRGPCRRARHARIQHRSRGQAGPGRSQLPGPERNQCRAHPHGLLRQGTPRRGLQRHLLLVAESARPDRAQRPARSPLLARLSGLARTMLHG